MKNISAKQWGIIAACVLAGIFIAVWLYRTRYGRQLLKPVAKLEAAIAGTPGNVTPPLAQPRYVGFGEYYDPFAIWPYGANSNYQLFLNTNSGVPTSQAASFGMRTAATAPASSLFAGNNALNFGSNGGGQNGSSGGR